MFALCCLSGVAVAQATDSLQPGRAVEREIAGGESHSYQIHLSAGQFVRFRLEQQALDSVLILLAPDGKQMAEVNLTDAGESEPLALEALLAGSYRLTVRGNGGATMRRAYLVSSESRAAFLATVQDSYQLYIDLLMRQHRNEPAQGLSALALGSSERQRARSLLDLLAESRADVRQGVDAALIERERSLGRQLNDKAPRLTQANKPDQAAALRQEISQLETDYERAQADIRKGSPHYAALTQPQPLELKEIQTQLDADTLLLEYALGTDRNSGACKCLASIWTGPVCHAVTSPLVSHFK